MCIRDRCNMVLLFLLFGYFFCFDFCVDFWSYFGCIFDSFWAPFGHQTSPKSGQKSIRKLTSKKGGSREVRPRPRLAELGSRRANYQRGLAIKKVQLFEEGWKLHADLVGRRIKMHRQQQVLFFEFVFSRVLGTRWYFLLTEQQELA